MDTSGAPPIQSKSTSSTATSGAEKSKSKRVEESVGKSASNTPERAAHDESYNHRIGVVACEKSIDLLVSQETTASLARSKVLSHLENEKGLKVRPVIVPGTGLTAYTMVRKEIPVPLQDQILADLNVIPDFINESMKTVLIVPEKTYIAAIVCSVSVMIAAYNEFISKQTFPAKTEPLVVFMGYEENMGRLANKRREVNTDLIGCVGLAFSLSFSELANLIAWAEVNMPDKVIFEIVTEESSVIIRLKSEAKPKLLPPSADVSRDYAVEMLEGGRLTLTIQAFVVGKEGGERREDYHRTGVGSKSIYGWFGDYVQEIRPNTFGTGIAGTGIIQLYLKVPINYEQHANKQLGILANEGKDGFSMSKLTGIKVRFSATLPQARVREGLAAVIESDGGASEAKLMGGGGWATAAHAAGASAAAGRVTACGWWQL